MLCYLLLLSPIVFVAVLVLPPLVHCVVCCSCWGATNRCMRLCCAVAFSISAVHSFVNRNLIEFSSFVTVNWYCEYHIFISMLKSVKCNLLLRNIVARTWVGIFVSFLWYFRIDFRNMLYVSYSFKIKKNFFLFGFLIYRLTAEHLLFAFVSTPMAHILSILSCLFCWDRTDFQIVLIAFLCNLI